MAADNILLGSFVLDGLAPLPKGSAKVEISFHIDVNGIVTATARDKGTGASRSGKPIYIHI